LWQFASDTVFGPSPAVVASGVYVADDGGNVYAFGMTGMAR
jgi:outer membrane protein assembly factor BamB